MGVSVASLFAARLTRPAGELRATAEFDMQVYRDQLSEIDRDLARGTLTEAEAGRLRTEVSRRLLEADRSATTPVVAVASGRRWNGLAAGLIALPLLAAYPLYLQLGAPGYPDLPLALRFSMSEELRQTRPAQAEAEAKTPAAPAPQVDAEYQDLMARLRQAVADRPDDARGLQLLASNEARLGNFIAARTAMENLIRVKGDAATDDDYASLAEMMIMAAGGYVSPEAEAALTKSLTINGENGTARYYAGVMFAQIGRFDRTFQLWKMLVEQGPADAPWIAPIRAEMAEVAERAGVEYSLPETALPGPDAAAMAGAAEMSDTDRQAMIEGMVAQLSDRLATDGGSSAEWARLITSLSVLGKGDQAAQILAEARGKFAGKPDDLAVLDQAAAQAGLAE